MKQKDDGYTLLLKQHAMDIDAMIEAMARRAGEGFPVRALSIFVNYLPIYCHVAATSIMPANPLPSTPQRVPLSGQLPPPLPLLPGSSR